MILEDIILPLIFLDSSSLRVGFSDSIFYAIRKV